MTDTSENITDELNKLLEIKKNNDKEKNKSLSSSSNSNHTDSSNCKCNKCSSVSEISKVEKIKDDSSSLSESDLITAIGEMRNDYIKMLKMMTSLTKEIKNMQESISDIKEKRLSSSYDEDSSDDSSQSSSSYQEHIDKILSRKLDELTTKVENKLNELNYFTTHTRRIAVSKVKTKV